MKKQVLIVITSVTVGLGAGYILFAQPNTIESVDISDTNSMRQSDMQMESMHSEVEVDPSLPIPAVEVSALPDSKDGYNLKIDVQNFTFTPENVGKANEPNTGHAHIYVNDEKVGRIYGNWFYLSSKYLNDGENRISITLNANDHSDWLLNGEHIESVVMVTK